MYSPLRDCIIPFVVGAGFAAAPFIGGLRRLPRWIRIALLIAGLSWIAGSFLVLAQYYLMVHVSAVTYRFVATGKYITFGMGFGIVLLLIVSGEIFKALRQLDASRNKRLRIAHDEGGREHVSPADEANGPIAI
jgi:hypothetical protein